MAEQERYTKVRICRSRCDSANDHEKSMCASSHHLPRWFPIPLVDDTAQARHELSRLLLKGGVPFDLKRLAAFRRVSKASGVATAKSSLSGHDMLLASWLAEL